MIIRICKVVNVMSAATLVLLLLLGNPVLGQAILVGPVTHVRDGDTIEVGGVPVRLDGLHCPERDETGGWQATAMMQELVDGAEVACRLTGETTYDRQVGRCEAGGADLGEVLILARRCARCPRYDEELLYVEAQSRAGPWQGAMPGYCDRGSSF